MWWVSFPCEQFYQFSTWWKNLSTQVHACTHTHTHTQSNCLCVCVCVAHYLNWLEEKRDRQKSPSVCPTSPSCLLALSLAAFVRHPPPPHPPSAPSSRRPITSLSLPRSSSRCQGPSHRAVDTLNYFLPCVALSKAMCINSCRQKKKTKKKLRWAEETATHKLFIQQGERSNASRGKHF